MNRPLFINLPDAKEGPTKDQKIEKSNDKQEDLKKSIRLYIKVK